MTTSQIRAIVIAVIVLIIVAAIGWPSLLFVAGFVACLILRR